MSDEELAKVVEFIQRGDKLVICKNGVFNPSYMVGILEDRESYNGVFQHVRSIEERQRKQLELSSEPSSFAKALSATEFGLLDDPKSRTAIQEEVAREERRLRSGH
jgi:hypothetical protein